MERVHAIVEGRVQGVGFRYFVYEEARRLGVCGWVRNRWDDTVELTAEGERSALESLLVRVRRGPSMSNVTTVRDHWQAASGEFEDFQIRSSV